MFVGRHGQSDHEKQHDRGEVSEMFDGELIEQDNNNGSFNVFKEFPSPI